MYCIFKQIIYSANKYIPIILKYIEYVNMLKMFQLYVYVHFEKMLNDISYGAFP